LPGWGELLLQGYAAPAVQVRDKLTWTLAEARLMTGLSRNTRDGGGMIDFHPALRSFL
jgi:hypothetical protein